MGTLSTKSEGPAAALVNPRLGTLAATDADQLHLVYQPQVSLETSTICGFEVFPHWTDPERGAVAPSEFLGTAENNGVVVPIGEWVLRGAWRQLEAWERGGYTGLRMSVKVSPVQLESPRFEATLRQILGAGTVPASQLEFDLAERVTIDATPEIGHRLEALKRLGVSIAIDDFGTEYSNLARLSRLPVDCIKIGAGLTRNVAHSPSAAAICRAICELARSLELRVVAAGVETEGQLAFHTRLRCHEAQGILLSPPVGAERATELLADNARLGMRGRGAERERHLLLLDDESNIVSALRRLFRRDGYVIHSATRAPAAFELLAQHPIGVVISDQRMPQMSGTEFLRRVKSLHPHTIRIVLSGYTELQAITDAVNEGAIYKFLTKPWNDEQLREQIHAAFEQFELLGEKERLQRELIDTNARLQGLLNRELEQREHESAVLHVAHEALSAVPVPVVGFDPSGLIAMSNRAADRLFGRGATLLGEPANDVLPAQALEGCDAADGGDRIVVCGALRFRRRVARLGGSAGLRATLVTFLPVEEPS
ncbi:MAG TPA: EAL domain-containing protein [Burkholderiaceae bacterium]|nr:EAL domain-containing protein [Burkholderiaceae bacterium]